MHEHRNFDAIPAGACTLNVGDFEVGSNGDGAKTAPVRLVARSGQPIEHWFWGRVVHDMAGMHLHKPRLTIDYVHDSKEVIGYLNKFETDTGDLVTSGALVPFKESDRATEIIHKMAAGVPYEASINFGGDGIKVQEIFEGEIAQVNGFEFDGPGVIVREWPLRGVAICPYGADMNTESAAFAASDKVFRATVFTEPEAPTEEDSAMSQSVDVEAKVEPVAEEMEQEENQEVALESVEDKPVEELEQPEAAPESVETELTEEPSEELEAERETLTREEFAQIADEFGNDVAVSVMRDGGDYEDALRLHADAMKAENERLRTRIAELENSEDDGAPAQVSAKKTKAKLFNTGK